MNRFETLDQLPDRYRKQAIEKMNLQKVPKRRATKYHNKSVEVSNIRFDSQKEAQRYKVLTDKLKNGEISDLRLQVNFTIVEGFTTPTGERIKPVKYVADFTYYDSNGEYVVEDVKSPATKKDKAYRLKNKLMADKFGIIIKET